MTRQEAHRLFASLRSKFAAKRPELGSLRLVLRKRHFLRRPAPRDLAWYETSDGTVNLMEKALAGPSGRVEGLLAHELGHALDADASRPYAERRADALAKRVLGVPIRYDKDDVQNLKHGATPRPARLHENREDDMKRNPRYTVDTTQRGMVEIDGTIRFLDEVFEDETALSVMAAVGDGEAKKALRTLSSGKSAQKKRESIAWMQDAYNVSPQSVIAGAGSKDLAKQVLDGWAYFGREPSGAPQEVREAAVRAVRMIDASPMLSVSGSAEQKSSALAAARTIAQAMGLLSDRDQGVLIAHADRLIRNPRGRMKRNPRKIKKPALDALGNVITIGDLVVGVKGRWEHDRGVVKWISDDGEVCEVEMGLRRVSVRAADFAVMGKARNPAVIATIYAGYRVKNNETGEVWTVMGAGPKVRGIYTYVVKDSDGKKWSLKREVLLQGQKDGTLTVLDIANRNPQKGYKMPEAQARHTAEGLLARMLADGADTFAKKVAWVKRHIPSIDRPRTFVGWVTKGERGRVVYQRNPTPAYHRSRGEAELVLAEDAYRKASAMRRRGNASGSHDALIHAHRMAALAESDLLDGASPRAAEAKRLAWWKAYSALAADKKRNPAKGTVRVAAYADKKRTVPTVNEDVYFEAAGPFVRSKSLSKSETVQTVKDDAHLITHKPTGMIVYVGGGASLYADKKKDAVAAMRDLRAWLKKLSKDEVRTISEGFTFGSRDMTPAQEALMREALGICRSGKIQRNPRKSR